MPASDFRQFQPPIREFQYENVGTPRCQASVAFLDRYLAKPTEQPVTSAECISKAGLQWVFCLLADFECTFVSNERLRN
ncbi:hypothetical protein Y032_1120g3633 [Ancylostoma ceylanicum]|uniref:Uncharacterized protein n=1 Tax=Ancylostoma ceylanicum TaxID=53326 RepID=A0A016W6I3_9BILA|nr:hypothetical protein Y032_1120g3633 [Ancylostoma ceylanicum]